MPQEDDKPLSRLVAQGWEIIGFSHGFEPSSGAACENVLLRRQKQHKILSIRKKMLGRGLVVRELEL